MRNRVHEMNRSPTVKDVALLSQVSTATVSRVLNADSRISAKTTERVRKAINELGYAPNHFARGLKTSRSRTVGFIAPEFNNDFFMGIAKGVESRLRSSGYALVICNSNENVDDERLRLDLLLEKGVDGLIVIPASHLGDHFHRVPRQSVPLVLVDRLVDGLECDSVLVDNINGTYQAVELAIQEGIRRFGFIGGDQTLTSASERHAGFRRVLDDYRLPYDASLVLFGNFHIDSGYELMAQLMSQTAPPPCVFISNYFMHVGATKYLMEHKDSLRTIPELISFDEMELSFTLGYCRTIVRQPILEIGEKAADLLLERIEQTPDSSPRTCRMKTEILVR
jgi:LacI family transcriptional regulator